MDLADRERRCRDYAEALEEERRKILVFQRELPLCLQLVSEAIESCNQATGSEDASSYVRPVLEEFIPLKPNMSPSSSEESCRRCDKTTLAPLKEETPDWLRSVQLWNQQPDLIPGPDRPQKPVAVKFGGAFHPFEKEKLVPLQAASSTAVANAARDGETGGCREKPEEQSRPQTQPQRKERRSWSPELHRRFLNALQQLGGSHTATPKQIRELMQVDGLTNDEVKSHLQKYRLHNRRSTPTIESSPQAPQFVVVGGIWVPPPEYAAAAAQPTEGAGAPLGGIYAPVASKLPLEFGSQQQQQNKKVSRSPTGPFHPEGRCIPDNSSFEDDGATNRASPTSSSSQTVTA